MAKKGGSRKSVPVKGTSPGVPKDASSSHKYSTGGAGRATPACYGQRHKKQGNP